ncbi:zinc finger protein 618 isoform X3 [Leucoraja erinacea]|uniref:zinc finger protein 618 isoform X3 n=1 Tax=Leucoraja erinaceus TaxID=7782 RepID=UPI0024562BFF|nr:zinc finger protein 618 isoform X3 [Leucoraja erinacea]
MLGHGSPCSLQFCVCSVTDLRADCDCAHAQSRHSTQARTARMRPSSLARPFLPVSFESQRRKHRLVIVRPVTCGRQAALPLAGRASDVDAGQGRPFSVSGVVSPANERTARRPFSPHDIDGHPGKSSQMNDQEENMEWKPQQQASLKAYICGACGKKYKYYSCFRAHVRAHLENETSSVSAENSPQAKNFRYMCDICGKKYKYYSCFQEHRDLHAVDDPYDHAVETPAEVKTEQVDEIVRNPGSKTGSYICEYCGKRYKYYTPYQEHVALHASSDAESPLVKRNEAKLPNACEENNSSQNSSGGASVQKSDPPSVKNGSTCQTCGNEHKHCTCLRQQAHNSRARADNENSIAIKQVQSPRTSTTTTTTTTATAAAATASAAAAATTSTTPVVATAAASPEKKNAHRQSNCTNDVNSSVLEKERQHVAEKLLRVMCADLKALPVINGKDFVKLAQTLVDIGARYGSFPVGDVLGDMNTLALKHLPRMYNQVKVKVTCALGSNACWGIGVTCHCQNVGSESFYILTAHQVEGLQIKRYVLGIKEVDGKETGEQVHQWVLNVLSEFVMSEMQTIYVTDSKVSSAALLKAGMCLRCSACALNSTVRSVLNERTLQAQNMPEVTELVSNCIQIMSSLEQGTGTPELSSILEGHQAPCCWNSVADSLLLVHDKYEQLRELISSRKELKHFQNCNKTLLSNLAAILTPVKQAVIELSCENKPTLQLVLPTYIKLEKLFTSKANDAGSVSKLCHLFLESLKENFKMENAHKVAMVLDPHSKHLRSVPHYQQEEVISRVCEMISDIGQSCEDVVEFQPARKRVRGISENPKNPSEANRDERKEEVFQYLKEPVPNKTTDLFSYWSNTTQKHPKLAKLAFWLLAVPAVGARSGCLNNLETFSGKQKKQLTPEVMNKLMFLKSNLQ